MLRPQSFSLRVTFSAALCPQCSFRTAATGSTSLRTALSSSAVMRCQLGMVKLLILRRAPQALSLLARTPSWLLSQGIRNVPRPRASLRRRSMLSNERRITWTVWVMASCAAPRASLRPRRQADIAAGCKRPLSRKPLNVSKGPQLARLPPHAWI